MNKYNINLKEYGDYLNKVRSNIFAILPLYEEKLQNKEVYVEEYVKYTLDSVVYVKGIIDELPNGYWYVETLAALESLDEKVRTDDNHKFVRKKVLDTAKLISEEIQHLNLNDVVR